MLKLHGLIAAPHTPFAPDGSLHLPAIEQQVGHLLANGVTTVFIGGSTGEAHSLQAGERRALTERWTAVARGTPLVVTVHAGSNCLEDSRMLAEHAQACGAAAVAAFAPSYYKPRTVDALVECCACIAAAASRTPFYYYDIPALTGVQLPMPEFLSQGKERIPTLAGIKYTCTDQLQYQLCLHHADGAFDIPWGSDETLLAALALGAQGAIGSSYNFAAKLYRRILADFAAGDLASARAHQYRSARLIQTVASYGYLGATKAVMSMVGVNVGPARLPNSNPTAEQVVSLRKELERIGFFEWIGGN